MGTLNSIIALQTSTGAISCVQDELGIPSGSRAKPSGLQVQEQLDPEAEWEHTAQRVCVPTWRVY